uniref:Uncharacterized protein n=1 Tax=Oryza sativa subsp. japonica TaxID=39947 RepID=Q69KL3_ORYSJ|nr:hypothetical protein [Oryza sativa Japonica Group]BAD72468.1 hypothetical protein [Oryza sativa Japonica Group]
MELETLLPTLYLIGVVGNGHAMPRTVHPSIHPSIHPKREDTQRQYLNPVAIELKGIVAGKEPALLVLPITYIVFHGKLSPSSIVSIIISILFLSPKKTEGTPSKWKKHRTRRRGIEPRATLVWGRSTYTVDLHEPSPT